MFLSSPFVLWYPIQFKGLGNKGIYSRTVCLYSSQGKYLAAEAGDPSPCCVQAYQGIFLCQKTQCLFTGTTLTFQVTAMARRGIDAGTIQFYLILRSFLHSEPSSFFLCFLILIEEYLWVLRKPQCAVRCVWVDSCKGLSIWFSLCCPFVFHPWRMSACINQQSPSSMKTFFLW